MLETAPESDTVAAHARVVVSGSGVMTSSLGAYLQFAASDFGLADDAVTVSDTSDLPL